ncbi:hypothetical protein C1645_809168 [Glomus cerebriforme]|uniref:Uncharacterized protein n=1 Tax=Glomus cerebriforme TaxID=658196 RepID=A0A397SDG5_9GLOM|nr:hypothetical protein C1645_809168 [Glomus cerebriforme]
MTRTMISNNTNKYFEKIRGSNCSRVHRIKLTTSFSNSPYEKIINSNNIIINHSKNCNNCNDSGNCMKLITERLARIEDLVNNLYKLTQDLKNQKKNPYYNNNNNNNNININNNNNNIQKQKNRMFQNIDLSSCKLDDLQKLVIFTTNAISSQPSISSKFVHNNETFYTENLKKTDFTTTQREEKINCDTLDLKPPSQPVILKHKNHVSTEGARDNN